MLFIINLLYLIGVVSFVWGLSMLSHPDTARRGNIYAGVGMLLSILAAIMQPIDGAYNNYGLIALSLAIGTAIGGVSAYKVKMTAMPQMVSIFNGLGGACSVVLAVAEFERFYAGKSEMDTATIVVAVLTLLIGAIAFTGSLLAWGKLEGKINDSAITFKNHHILNMALLLGAIVLGGMLTVQGQEAGNLLLILLIIVSLVYGLSFVAPIGGADMPVVIAWLNTFSGLAGALAGIIYNNLLMMVGGILVGASGTILTVMMCKAMNRSLLNVLIGGFGGGGVASKAASGDQVVKEVSLNDAAIQLSYSGSVVIVPGYGLAVAQAQKVCKELDDVLTANGVDVKYAIHPVAGRMPGHMNVLLAEADVPYPKLLDLDDANSALANTDVVVVVGANDVVNPAAEDDPSSPIYGMPVLKVWDAKHVIVMKRSMRSGYAGIENPLFFHPKTKMLFGDAKDTLVKLVSEAKSL